MIAKIKGNKSLSATLYYADHKGDLIYTKNLVGDSLKDYRVQMDLLQKCYNDPLEGRKAKNFTFHAVISPSIEDGKNLNTDQWNRIANNYLKKMDLDNQQAVGFLHDDKEHKHLHIVINRVKEDDFSLIRDSNFHRKSQAVGNEIAKEMGLIRASEIQKQRENTKERGDDFKEPKIEGSKALFKRELHEIASQGYNDSKGYFIALEKKGYSVKEFADKETGELRGYGVEKNGTFMNATEIDRKLSLKNVQEKWKEIAQSKTLSSEREIQRQIEKSIENEKRISENQKDRGHSLGL